jgi:hypothetical protein
LCPFCTDRRAILTVPVLNAREGRRNGVIGCGGRYPLSARCSELNSRGPWDRRTASAWTDNRHPLDTGTAPVNASQHNDGLCEIGSAERLLSGGLSGDAAGGGGEGSYREPQHIVDTEGVQRSGQSREHSEEEVCHMSYVICHTHQRHAMDTHWTASPLTPALICSNL